jgi:cytidylate kinase
MTHSMSSARLFGAVAGAHRLSEGRAEPIPRPAFTIALSREAGARGADIGRALGARLGWPVYDKELLQKIGEEIGLHAAELETVDERNPGWLRECLDSFRTGPVVSAPAYVHRLVKTLVALAAKGACVIVGRGAAQVLPPATTLRIRLVGAVEDRVAEFQRRFGLSREEAVKRVEETDRDRTRFVREHFHKDPADPRLYDLLLNTSRLTPTDCVDLIAEALRRLQACAVHA